MKAKFVNEAMEDILRPKDPTDVGQELVSQSTEGMRDEILKDTEDEYDPDLYDDKPEALIYVLSEKLGSAMEIYLPWQYKEELYNLYNSGGEIATYDHDGPIAFDPNEALPEGWELFWHEDNFDQGDLIFIKKP